MAVVDFLKQTRLAFLAHRKWTDRRHGPGWRGFHGDAIYQGVVAHLLETFPFTSFVETGTSRGYTTEFIAGKFQRLPVFTSEILESTYRTAGFALSKYPNVEQSLGSSEKCVEDLIRGGKLGEMPLFYLDAHWQNYWPLRGELAAISAAHLKAVIVIDDFEVPGQPQFEFDEYPASDSSPGGNCNFEYIRPALSAENRYAIAYPRYGIKDAFPRGQQVSQNRLRGHLVLAQNMDEEFGQFIRDPFFTSYYQPANT